jgi:hypothetical protein
MGSLPSVVRNTGSKSDSVGAAQLPQMVIPPTESESTPSSIDEDTTTTDAIKDPATLAEASDRQSDDHDDKIGQSPSMIPVEQVQN